MAEPEPPPPAAPAGPSQAVLGSLGEFNCKSDSISSYLERMQLYFEANSVKEDRKVADLLTVIGAKTYETLHSLLVPVRPGDKTCNELLGLLQKH